MKVKFFTFLAFPLLAGLPMKAFVSSNIAKTANGFLYAWGLATVN